MSFPNRVLQTISNLWRGGPREFGSEIFYPVGMAVDMWGKGDLIRDFCEIPEINAVLNMKARMWSAGELKIVDKNGKDASKRHPEVAARLKNPNWFQDQKEFMRQTKLNHEIFGDEFIYNLFPLGMNPGRSTGLFTLPPNLIEVEYNSEKLYFTVSAAPKNGIKYTYKDNGTDYPLPTEAMIHFNDNRVTFTDQTSGKEFLRGQSKLDALRAVRQNLRFTYESLGVILKNRGALGIISNDGNDGIGASIPIKDTEKQVIQDGYRNYGGLSHQNQLIITSAKVKWQQMSVNPDKLGLFQGKREDFAKVLDSEGMAMELFVNQGSTYENQKQARKGTYQETIIPDAVEWVSGLNGHLMIDTDDRIIVDYTHLPVFQEDLKARGDAYKAVADGLNRMLVDRAITIEEYREEIERLGVKLHAQGLPDPSSEAKDNSETLAAQAALRGSVGGVQGILGIQASVSQGLTTRESALSMLTIVYGFTPEAADSLLGKPKEDNGQTEENAGGTPPGGEADPGSEAAA